MWDTIVLQPMINFLVAMTNGLGGSFGMAIVILTIIVRLITFPLFIKQLPLTDHHPFAEAAAKAALAAHLQGKFWEVYTALFENQATLTDKTIEAHAKAAGLDMARYAKDVASQAVADRIARDIADADRAQVDGTPTHFVDGMMVDFDQLEAALKEATGR